MGKVEAKVEEHIEHGKEIACVVSCDYLITAGVSNWGGYALAVGLYVLSMCPIHVRYVQRGLENVSKQEKCKGDFVSTVEEVSDNHLLSLV